MADKGRIWEEEKKIYIKQPKIVKELNYSSTQFHLKFNIYFGKFFLKTLLYAHGMSWMCVCVFLYVFCLYVAYDAYVSIYIYNINKRAQTGKNVFDCWWTGANKGMLKSPFFYYKTHTNSHTYNDINIDALHIRVSFSHQFAYNTNATQ